MPSTWYFHVGKSTFETSLGGHFFGQIFGANHLLGRNIKTLLKVIVASIQKISNDAHS